MSWLYLAQRWHSSAVSVVVRCVWPPPLEVCKTVGGVARVTALRQQGPP